MQLPDRQKVQDRKVRMRAAMDAKWIQLRDYAPLIAKLQMVGPTNPIECALLREVLQLMLAEMNFSAQETAEMMLFDFDLEGEGPEEPGVPSPTL